MALWHLEVGIDNLLESVVDMAMIIEPTKDDLVVHTVSPYCPVPDMFIPHKYQNIIPPNPLFDDNDSFITPRSREWFTFMYNLEKNMSQEDRAIAIEAKVYEKHVDLRRLLEDNERERPKKEQDAIIQARDEVQRLKNVQQALYHGTTPKYLPWRTGLSNKLTSYFIVINLANETFAFIIIKHVLSRQGCSIVTKVL
ncbi:hypothetical protein RhiirA1_445732 [Rhizophagus irregularis]|uniref:Uncharacterized protein n=1 Tax=Rhizophagus irregularis TaxID=588596 RepID=A0A2N0R5N2_9GLOM|nr:hypothetical protein RhiirA1_445732 [Rhizophagus irregularis]